MAHQLHIDEIDPDDIQTLLGDDNPLTNVELTDENWVR